MALKMVGASSRYLMCTPTKMRLSTARIAAARIVSEGCPGGDRVSSEERAYPGG